MEDLMTASRMFLISAVAALGILGLASPQAQAADVSANFAGKTVTIYVGYDPGGGAGTEATLIGKYLAKEIPGAPNVIVAYKPGAGGRLLANYIYNVAPDNGLEIGRIGNTVSIDNLLQEPSIKFESDKFGWVGSFASAKWLLYLRADPEFASVDTLKKAKKKPKIGSISTSHKSFLNARLVEETLGLHFDMVTGYPGGNDIGLAVERGEVDGYLVDYGSFMQRTLKLYQEGKVMVPVTSGYADRSPLKALEKVPTIWALAPKDQEPLIELAALPWDRPFVVSPKTPAPILDALRTAYENVGKNKDFQVEYLKTIGDAVDYTKGAKMQSDVQSMMKASPKTVEGLKALFQVK
jgi:tripartite-type tricarboxylate transporter receptor subunit TctC